MKNNFLCQFNDIVENTSKGFCLSNNETVFAVKKEGQLFIYKNSCPHLGVELDLIQCSTHGALFLIENGECISGPCVGKALKAIPFTVDENLNVVISLDL
jgi:nitrite reductase/ring-hydroxylating ferredoxin subunit